MCGKAAYFVPVFERGRLGKADKNAQGRSTFKIKGALETLWLFGGGGFGGFGGGSSGGGGEGFEFLEFFGGELVAAFGGFAEPFAGEFIVLGDAIAVEIAEAEFVLGIVGAGFGALFLKFDEVFVGL